jgi:predicted lipid-binding transport protein (Tim44 family)
VLPLEVTRELRLKNLLEDLMKKQIQSLWFAGALVLFLSVGVALNAQTPGQTPGQTPAPDPQAQQPATPDQAQPSTPSQTPAQTPAQAGQAASDSQPQAGQAEGGQSFTGTVVKSDGKYVFKDEATGNTYAIDHQDDVQKFEGKKVKVHGTLDANGKMIHIQ